MRGRLFGWMVAIMVTLWMGCASSSTPPDYFGLYATNAAPGNFSRSPLTIGMGPVQLPDYLDRSTIVTRLSPTRLQINANQRWAGSLQGEILRVLAANIKSETGSRQVVVFPWGSDVEPDIRFRIVIHAFEGGTDQGVHLNATWSMERDSTDEAVVLRDYDGVEKVTGKDFEALTEAMGRALSAMGHEMATAVMATGKPVTQDINR